MTLGENKVVRGLDSVNHAKLLPLSRSSVFIFFIVVFTSCTTAEKAKILFPFENSTNSNNSTESKKFFSFADTFPDNFVKGSLPFTMTCKKLMYNFFFMFYRTLNEKRTIGTELTHATRSDLYLLCMCACVRVCVCVCVHVSMCGHACV